MEVVFQRGRADLESQGKEPVLFETDTANPDVYKAHKVSGLTTAIELDTSEGWIDLVNFADKTRGRPLVINTAARNLTAVTKFGKTLESTLGELDRELITLWTINRQRDSLELMADYLETLPVSDRHILHVVRNLYFGEPEKFQLYNDSESRKRVESAGGKNIDFPDLADRVADDLVTKRLTIKRASPPTAHRCCRCQASAACAAAGWPPLPSAHGRACSA